MKKSILALVVATATVLFACSPVESAPAPKLDWTVQPKDLAELNARILDWQKEYNELTAPKQLDGMIVESVLKLNLERGLYVERALVSFLDVWVNDTAPSEQVSQYPAIDAVIQKEGNPNLTALFLFRRDGKSILWNWTASLQSPLGETNLYTPPALSKVIPEIDLIRTNGHSFMYSDLSPNKQKELSETLSRDVSVFMKGVFEGHDLLAEGAQFEFLKQGFGNMSNIVFRLPSGKKTFDYVDLGKKSTISLDEM